MIQARDNGQLVFLDMLAGSSHLTAQRSTEQIVSPLQRLYQIVNESVKRLQTGNENDRTVIMVDDASLLEVTAGGRSDQVLAFLQYCRAIHSGHNVRLLFLPSSYAAVISLSHKLCMRAGVGDFFLFLLLSIFAFIE